MELYKTVRKEAEATQIIEKSRFITHIKPVDSREEAELFIADIKSRYKDATHNVPAMVIGEKSQIQWASDDGEPQGTSGAPMVQMMVKEGLTNLVVVVTRYFGGIKLGTGGLVRAYTSSARLGIEAAGICSVREICAMEIRIAYPYLAKLQSMARDTLAEGEGGFAIGDIQYSEAVNMKIMTLPEDRDSFCGMLGNLTAGEAEIVSEELICDRV